MGEHRARKQCPAKGQTIRCQVLDNNLRFIIILLSTPTSLNLPLSISPSNQHFVCIPPMVYTNVSLRSASLLLLVTGSITLYK